MLKLLNSELKDYVKIFVHQVTNQNVYENMLAFSFKENQPKTLTKIHSSEYIQTKSYPISDFATHTSSEQTLDNGTILIEMINDAAFKFKQSDNFLSYLIVVAVVPPDDLSDAPLGDIFLSKITAEIVLLGGKLQRKGLIFKIAPDNDPSLFKEWGNPGEVWTGAVHRSPGEGRFMVGEISYNDSASFF